MILQVYELIRYQVDKDIVQVVVDKEGGEVHYLPHHVVIHCDKETAQVQVAYDA